MHALTDVALFLHLLAFAAYGAAGFAQQRFLQASARVGLEAPVRDAYERLAAMVVTKIELPAIFTAVASGAAFVAAGPDLMRQPWLHAKLTLVVLLLVLSHLEMFNARRIVRAREAGDTAQIAERKTRHGVLGMVGGLVFLAVLGIVCFWRTA